MLSYQLERLRGFNHMGWSMETSGIWVHADILPCRNRCGYCQVGRKTIDNVSFARLAALVDRFAEWKEKHENPEFRVGHWFGYTHDFDLATMIEEKRLRALAGWNLEVILLGGLADRSEKEMRNWLTERFEAGFTTVIASFMGHGPFHDRRAGRRGDFERLMNIQRIAAELGMTLRQRIFLTQNTLRFVDELLEKLDGIPSKVEPQIGQNTHAYVLGSFIGQ
jgi:hypothetical protein